MLSCKDVSERCTDYLERELTWRVRIEYWMHLAMCAVCRRYVGQMRTTTVLLTRVRDNAPAHAPPDPSLREAFRATREGRPLS